MTLRKQNKFKRKKKKEKLTLVKQPLVKHWEGLASGGRLSGLGSKAPFPKRNDPV